MNVIQISLATIAAIFGVITLGLGYALYPVVEAFYELVPSGPFHYSAELAMWAFNTAPFIFVFSLVLFIVITAIKKQGEDYVRVY